MPFESSLGEIKRGDWGLSHLGECNKVDTMNV
jgi:hypothetical protein